MTTLVDNDVGDDVGDWQRWQRRYRPDKTIPTESQLECSSVLSRTLVLKVYTLCSFVVGLSLAVVSEKHAM